MKLSVTFLIVVKEQTKKNNNNNNKPEVGLVSSITALKRISCSD